MAKRLREDEAIGPALPPPVDEEVGPSLPEGYRSEVLRENLVHTDSLLQSEEESAGPAPISEPMAAVEETEEDNRAAVSTGQDQPMVFDQTAEEQAGKRRKGAGISSGRLGSYCQQHWNMSKYI